MRCLEKIDADCRPLWTLSSGRSSPTKEIPARTLHRKSLHQHICELLPTLALVRRRSAGRTLSTAFSNSTPAPPTKTGRHSLGLGAHPGHFRSQQRHCATGRQRQPAGTEKLNPGACWAVIGVLTDNHHFNCSTGTYLGPQTYRTWGINGLTRAFFATKNSRSCCI
ncbi:MAG: hypothetical protein CM15mP120_21670 [Pseudomonadota bacterium]|nr:MAG: hypothetical protein CM15mP120_21670 [Pseudomonadota bacterium]